MSTLRVPNVALRGVVSAVPDNERTWEQEAERFGLEEMQRVVKNIGVTRRTVAEHLCTSDLCQAAAENLIAKLGWAKDSVDAIIMVTQTPDYPSPATACLVQHRMGLSTRAAAFDINLGCSGYTYGLWIVGSLLMTGTMKRALLLAGDTVSRGASPFDRSVVPLFGDGGSATALEYSPDAPPMAFEMGTDGAGAIHLHTLAGGGKHQVKERDHVFYERRDGIIRSNLHTYMNGAEVLTFAIQSVPPMVEAVLKAAEWTEADVDYYIFHQASRFMLKNIGRCLRISPTTNKLVIALDGYGNTSSASIPVAMNDQVRELEQTTRKVILAGFGIGWSWCAVALPLGPIYLPAILRVPDVPHVGEFEGLKDHETVGDPIFRTLMEKISDLVANILTDEERALRVDDTGCYEKYGIRFHELRVEHLEVLRRWRNHADIQRFMVFREEITHAMQEQWFRDIDRARVLHLESYTMLEFRGEIIGMTQLKKIDYPHHTAEGGIIIFRPEHQGGLIPYRVAIGGMDSDFLHRGLEIISATIRKMNTRAQRFTRSLGYQLVDPDPAGDVLHGSVRVDDYFRAAKKWRPLLAADAEKGYPLG